MLHGVRPGVVLRSAMPTRSLEGAQGRAKADAHRNRDGPVNSRSCTKKSSQIIPCTTCMVLFTLALLIYTICLFGTWVHRHGCGLRITAARLIPGTPGPSAASTCNLLTFCHPFTIVQYPLFCIVRILHFAACRHAEDKEQATACQGSHCRCRG